MSNQYSMKDVFKDYLTNKIELVEDNVKETRLSICQSCPYLNQTFKTCGQCGCLVTQKVKHKKSACPVGKW